MKPLQQFVIPISGLQDGTREYVFEVKDDFFNCFENSIIERGDIKVTTEFSKENNMYEMSFNIEGIVHTSCDRCASSYPFEVNANHFHIVKAVSELREEEENLSFIEDTSESLDLSSIIYEYIHLALPLLKSCPEYEDGDYSKYCDKKVLDTLESITPDEKSSNSVWDVLKNLEN